MARQQRRLAAIVSADVVGYSRLMQADETGTHARLKARLQELVAPSIERHGGRVFKLMGDGLLAEFPSVVAASDWAVEVQSAVAKANADGPPEHRIEYRVGVSLGDIIVDGDDLYGDGVNLAARLQEMAESGGVCLSDDAYRQARGKVSAPFTDGGEVSLKNIDAPVRVWRWAPEDLAATAQLAAKPALALPDKPSIAVLPFDNLSGDPEQQFFADGVAEDVITGLSCIRSLFVIARNSSFVYRGKSTDVTEVARELGVRYVLEGSVRRAGQRIRVTAQLIDASSRNHIWAQRFDRDLDDIFAVQDEITSAIVAAIGAEVDGAERARALHRSTAQLDAWTAYHRGIWHAYRHNDEDLKTAIRFFEIALSTDPNFASAHSGLSYVHYANALTGLGDYETEVQKAYEHARQAVKLDERDGTSYWSLGRAHRISGAVEQSIPCFKTALQLNPNFAQAHYNLGWSLVLAGRVSEGAVASLDRALRLSPRDPLLYAFQAVRSVATFLLGDATEALRWSETAVQQSNAHAHIFAVYACMLEANGKHEEATSVIQGILAKHPDYSRRLFRSTTPFVRSQDIEPMVENMRAAGLPE